MTGGTGAASAKQVTNNGSQFGNAWAEESRPAKGGTKATIETQYQPAGFSSATCTLCGAWRGELGSEPDPTSFVAHLVEVFRECRRVMREDAVLIVNLGDSYAGSGKGPTGHNGLGDQGRRQGFVNQRDAASVPAKSLYLIPERFSLAMLEDGWIVRSRLAGVKVAPMPESVSDRPTSAWEHVFMFSKQQKYFWDQEAVRIPSTSPEQELHNQRYAKVYTASDANAVHRQPGNVNSLGIHSRPGPGGANMRNWFTWPPASFPGAHFATFPPAVPELFIKAATSSYGACAACGAPWARVVEQLTSGQRNTHAGSAGHQVHRNGVSHTLRAHERTTTGWAPTCHCGTTEVRPCVVLDPFSGAGTSVLVANRLGRRGLGLELNPDYAELARRRIEDDAPLCHAIAAAPAVAQDRLL